MPPNGFYEMPTLTFVPASQFDLLLIELDLLQNLVPESHGKPVGVVVGHHLASSKRFDMHDALVLTHSWLRWVILAGGIFVAFHLLRVCVTGKPWNGHDNYLVWAFGRAFLYQALFGVLLYMMLGAAMSHPLPAWELDSRLGLPIHWPIVHGCGMIAALAVFHGGKALVYSRASLACRAPALFLVMIVTLSLIVAAIPWPFLKFGRPLLRTP